MKIYVIILIILYTAVASAEFNVRFLGPHETEYDSYFYTIRTKNDDISTCSGGNPSKKLVKEYSLAGAHDFLKNTRSSTFGRIESTIPNGFSSTFLEVLPHNVSLWLYFNNDTCLTDVGYQKSHKDNNGDWIYTCDGCDGGWKTCITETDMEMIDLLEETTEPLKDDCSSFSTGVIVICSIGGGIGSIMLLAVCIVHHRKRIMMVCKNSN